MILGTVVDSISAVLHAMADEGGFSPFAFCVATDPFALNGLRLASRLSQTAFFLVPPQLLRLSWYLGHGWRVVVLRPRRFLVLGAACLLSCGVSACLFEWNLSHAHYRLQALWEVWTGCLCVAAALLLPLHLRVERAIGNIEMRPGPP